MIEVSPSRLVQMSSLKFLNRHDLDLICRAHQVRTGFVQSERRYLEIKKEKASSLLIKTYPMSLSENCSIPKFHFCRLRANDGARII